MRVIPVVMCGGAGTRLWPASRPARPKQFLDLLGERSIFQDTLTRLRDIPGLGAPVIVTGVKHAEWVRRQVADLGLSATVLLEPEPRDSAPAIAAAMAEVAAQDPDAVTVVLASDHHVPDPAAFSEAVAQAAAAAATGYIVTLGVRPTIASTAYGYIRPGAALAGAERVSSVAKFAEKPASDVAEGYVREGYLWNSGNFIAPASLMLEEVRRFAPEVARAVEQAVGEKVRLADGSFRLADAFRGAPKISIDYAVMEKTEKAAVLPVGFAWSDLGAWDAVHEAEAQDGAGNAFRGQVVQVGSQGCIVRASEGVAVAAVGVQNLAIIVEPDAVLVCALDKAQDVKGAVEALKAVGAPQLDVMTLARPSLETLSARLGDWLEGSALPLWSTIGADHERGGFRELLSPTGRPVVSARRARVQWRQVYVYASAGLAGWAGPWRPAVRHGLEYCADKYLRPDGLYRTRVEEDGTPSDETAWVYDQAFAMMAMATAAKACPELPGLRARAEEVLATLNATRRNRAGGYVEAGDQPYWANPHMHLLEAALAWLDCGGGAVWEQLASEMIAIARERFIDPVHGFLREYFDESWRPAAGGLGDIVEPGHQFEWAWLLARWAQRTSDPSVLAAALRLFETGARGLDATRGVAIDELQADGPQMGIRQARARLWPQTEWLKASILLSTLVPERADELKGQTQGAALGLEKYLQTPVSGVWWDKMQLDGGFIDEPAPASSLYHIACAIYELRDRLKA